MAHARARVKRSPQRRRVTQASHPPRRRYSHFEASRTRAWMELAAELRGLIPEAIARARGGSPALLRVLTRFFKLPVRAKIVEAQTIQLELVHQVPRPEHSEKGVPPHADVGAPA